MVFDSRTRTLLNKFTLLSKLQGRFEPISEDGNIQYRAILYSRLDGAAGFWHIVNATSVLIATNGQLNSFIVEIQHFTNVSIAYFVSVKIYKFFTILEEETRHDCMYQGHY